MSGSVFTVMEKRGLTTLEIFQNRKEGKFLLRGAKEWDDKLDFSRYATDFNYVDILTGDYNAVGTETLAADFNELGLKDYLEQIKQLLREGRHEGIEFYYHRRKNIRIAFCKHSVTVGIKNRRHAIRTGAMRRHNLDDPEIDVLTDGLNLAGAMAYKNAIASHTLCRKAPNRAGI